MREQRVEQAARQVVVLDPQQRLGHVVATRELAAALEPGRGLTEERRTLVRLAAQDEDGPERLADRARGRLGEAGRGEQRRRSARARERRRRVTRRDGGARGERERERPAVRIPFHDVLGDARVALRGNLDRTQPRLEHRLLQRDVGAQ